jgi:hypothetical protein
VSAELQPPELAALVDTAERPRAANWSLRAALTRYAQPQPQRASAVIELLRRIESALKPHTKRLEREGPAVWAEVSAAAPATDEHLVGLLRALAEVDRLGDVLATWAVDRAGERPDGLVDEVVAGVAARLESLGVEREERPARPPARARR